MENIRGAQDWLRGMVHQQPGPRPDMCQKQLTSHPEWEPPRTDRFLFRLCAGQTSGLAMAISAQKDYGVETNAPGRKLECDERKCLPAKSHAAKAKRRGFCMRPEVTNAASRLLKNAPKQQARRQEMCESALRYARSCMLTDPLICFSTAC